MTQNEEQNICDWALNLVEQKYTPSQLKELKMIEQMRDKLVEIKLECCN